MFFLNNVQLGQVGTFQNGADLNADLSLVKSSSVRGFMGNVLGLLLKERSGNVTKTLDKLLVENFKSQEVFRVLDITRATLSQQPTWPDP